MVPTQECITQIDEVELRLVIVQSAYHRKANAYLSIVKNKLQYMMQRVRL